MNKTLSPSLLEERCVRFLSAIPDPLARARVGHMLFGKRYTRDIAQRCPPFEYEDD